jgi:hypothetical protein
VAIARDDQVHVRRQSGLEARQELARLGEGALVAVLARALVMAGDVEPDPVMDHKVVVARRIERDVDFGASLRAVHADVVVDATRPAPQVDGGHQRRVHTGRLGVRHEVRADVGSGGPRSPRARKTDSRDRPVSARARRRS